jgi:hypothetical protein
VSVTGWRFFRFQKPEDACRICRHPGIFTLLRRFALNLRRFHGVHHVSEALYDKALNVNRVLAYQGL